MPADYSRAAIYKIVAPGTDRCYIGSTTMKLAYRFGEHRRQWLRGAGAPTSRELMGLPGVRIELLESYPCANREALQRREGEHIRAHQGVCVNRSIAGRTRAEWVAENRDRVRATWRRWAARHPDAVRANNAAQRAKRAAQSLPPDASTAPTGKADIAPAGVSSISIPEASAMEPILAGVA